MQRQFWVETLGCPKNQVDSDKLTGTLLADGMTRAEHPEDADVVVVNTCAFVEQARQESIDTILSFDDLRKDGSKLVVTGCLAERYGDELAASLPEVDQVAGFGVPVTLGRKPESNSTESNSTESNSTESNSTVSKFDLLELPRPPAEAPWAYVKVAEGCDRNCGFCAIPSFRGKQRSRALGSILTEIDQLGAREIVLVAQDLASYGRDQGQGERQIVELIEQAAARADWVRLLYLYPSDLTDRLVDAILSTEVPYFDLSLQHVSRPLLRRMRRWGDGEVFLDRMGHIRSLEPGATFRSNFIVGYPGETEADHDALMEFVREARLDWCGFFSYSPEEGTYAMDLDGDVPATLVSERLSELSELQDRITSEARDALIGTSVRVLVDRPGEARSYREAPEIDGIISVPIDLPVGEFVTLEVVEATGPDLMAVRQ